MNDLLKTIGIVGGVVVILMQTYAKISVDLRLKKIPKLPSEELKSMFGDQKNRIYFGSIINALQKRGEDVSFTFPYLLDMALTKRNPTVAIIGMSSLRTYFSEVMGEIDLSKAFLPKDSRIKLEQMKEELNQLTIGSKKTGQARF